MQSPTDKFLNSIYFTDSLYGWAAGDSGTIIHTTDGGTNWMIQNSTTQNRITDIFFLNRNIGWASSLEVSASPYGTYLLRTTDGGDSWISPLNPDETIYTQSIFFQDSLIGWMGGRPTPIVKTTDGGINWSPAEIDSSVFSSFPVYDIQFINSEFGYASGGVLDCCGLIWWTTDGGNFWFITDTPNVAPEPVYKMYIKDSLNVLGVGGDFEPLGYGVGMMRTADGGFTWAYEYIGIKGVAWSIDFRTENEAWAPLGGEQKLIYSFDSGVSWNQMESPNGTMIYDIMFTDSLHGYGVGSEGAIIKYQHPNIIGVQQFQEYSLAGFMLYQNYPNPFNPVTRIKYSLREESFVRLAVYNLLGEEIALLVNEFKRAGFYEYEFDAGLLSSGVYIYRMESSGFMISKTMLIMR